MTTMIYQGEEPHPAHRLFGDAVDASYVHFETGQSPPEERGNQRSPLMRFKTGLGLRGQLIAEGTSPLQTCLTSRGEVVYLCADQTFVVLGLTKYLWASLIDRVITVSQTAADWIPREALQVDIVRPPISKYNLLCDVKPRSPDDGYILSIGEKRPTKRFDKLPEIAEETGREVRVVGEGHEDADYTNHALVNDQGWVDESEFPRLFENASIYVQPSVRDACPVASMEAMLTGTPTVVGPEVGTKELGAKSVELDQIVDEISAILVQSESERLNVDYDVENKTPENQARRFREAI